MAGVKRLRPDDRFVADTKCVEYARVHGLDLEEERDGWLDWCAASGRLYVDQQAGFRTWLRHAVQYGRGKPELAIATTLRDVLGPYRCPLGLGCDNGWVPDVSPATHCRCRDLVQSDERTFANKEGAPSEDSAPNLTLFTDLVEFSAPPTRSR